jgi:hypothetical protein
MSTALKCPNPSCPYLFDPSTVPPGVVLACPRCAMRFTLGTPGAAPPAHLPPGYGVPNRPAPANPLETAFGGMTPETAKADGEEGPRLPVRESPVQTILLVIVGAVALTAAGIAVWFASRPKDEQQPQGGVDVYKELNLSFEPPPEPWIADRETKTLLDAPFLAVYKRDNPEAHMAFGARDFKDHEPRPRELRGVLMQALDKIVDRETLKEFADDVPQTWMGLPVTGFKFSGLMRGAGSVEGEAMAVSSKGVGYWFIAWTGANEIYLEQRPAFEVGRSGCKLLNTRVNWKPSLGPAVAFKNNEIRYTILDSEHIWEEVGDDALAKGEDPKADKYLVVYDNPKRQNKQILAQLVVAVLDTVSDNSLQDATARAELHANADAELRGKYIFAEHTGQPEGDATNPAEGNTPVKLLRATHENKDPKYTRLYAVSGIRAGEKKTVVLYAWCPWVDRAAFDTKFIQIAKSLRADE